MILSRTYRILISILILFWAPSTYGYGIDIFTPHNTCVALIDSFGVPVVPDSITPASSYLSINSASGGTVDFCPPFGYTGVYVFGVTYYFTINNTVVSRNYVYNVTIGGCAININLVQDTLTCPGANKSFTVVANGVPPYTYRWGGGNSPVWPTWLTSNSPTFCEADSGHPVYVRVTDSVGCIGAAFSNGTGCPMSAFLSPQNICPNQLGLLAIVTGTGGQPYSYNWSLPYFPDTALLCGLTPGVYNLTVNDVYGCYATASYALGGSGSCSFTYHADPLTNIVKFYPHNDTILPISSYHWDFGDNTTDTSAYPVHTYANGTYFVVMTLYYSNGDTCYQNYYISINDSSNPTCQAFYLKYLDQANNDKVYFEDYSSYQPTYWHWDFGDGDTSLQQNPSHSYAIQAAHTVCLEVADTLGCTSRYCQKISTVPVHDLVAGLYRQHGAAPGFPFNVFLEYYNNGTLEANGTLTYRYPIGAIFDSSSTVPTAHDTVNRLLTFSFDSLLPGNSSLVLVYMTVDVNVPLGSAFDDTLWVTPIAGDDTPDDNVALVNTLVTGSWDPNDKAVSPKGEGAQGLVPISTRDLSYLIRFQNTGTGPALKVVVKDTIDSNIDATTIVETSASHDHVTMINGNIVSVTFHNIMLPDSGTNFATSQGYVMLRAKLKPSLPLDTRIANTASIYFDFNQPVVTNTVLTTLHDKVIGINEVHGFDFVLVPNPANTMVVLRGDFASGSVYEVVNQLGQILLTGEVKANSTTLNISQLSGGIYLVKVFNDDNVGIKRLTVTR